MYLGVSNNNLASTTLCFLHEAVQKFGFPLSSNVPLAITAFVSNKQNRGLNCCDAKIILYKSVRFVNIVCCLIICNQHMFCQGSGGSWRGECRCGLLYVLCPGNREM